MPRIDFFIPASADEETAMVDCRADSRQCHGCGRIDAPPVWDGMAVAYGKIYVSLRDGSVICLE